jgi:hypothetical protein
LKQLIAKLDDGVDWSESLRPCGDGRDR